MTELKPCARCNGSGLDDPGGFGDVDTCEECGGSGRSLLASQAKQAGQTEQDHLTEPADQMRGDGALALSAPPFGSKRAAALALYQPPFSFIHGYIYDANHRMVADQDGFQGGVETHIAARVRGWGRIGYLPDAEALQDEVGAAIAEALTEFWTARAATKQTTASETK